MSGRDVSEQLTAYIDGELSAEEKAAVEAALQQDPGLRALEKKLRQTVALMQGLPAPEPSRALRRAVLEGIAEPTFGEKLAAFFRPSRLLPVGALAAAAAAVVVVLRSNEALPADEEQLFMAQNMDVLEDMDVVGLDAADDLDVVANLHELEVTR